MTVSKFGVRLQIPDAEFQITLKEIVADQRKYAGLWMLPGYTKESPLGLRLYLATPSNEAGSLIGFDYREGNVVRNVERRALAYDSSIVVPFSEEVDLGGLIARPPAIDVRGPVEEYSAREINRKRLDGVWYPSHAFADVEDAAKGKGVRYSFLLSVFGDLYYVSSRENGMLIRVSEDNLDCLPPLYRRVHGAKVTIG